FFSSRRRHTRSKRDWSSDVCSSDLMDQFMKRAVQLAAENVRDGGEPFGAVLVKDGRIVTEGVNELHKKYDISGHAELVAIRKARSEERRVGKESRWRRSKYRGRAKS